MAKSANPPGADIDYDCTVRELDRIDAKLDRIEEHLLRLDARMAQIETAVGRLGLAGTETHAEVA